MREVYINFASSDISIDDLHTELLMSLLREVVLNALQGQVEVQRTLPAGSPIPALSSHWRITANATLRVQENDIPTMLLPSIYFC